MIGMQIKQATKQGMQTSILPKEESKNTASLAAVV